MDGYEGCGKWILGGLVAICIMVFGIPALVNVTLGHWMLADYEKVGSITKVGYTGTFCKSWEAEIIRGGMTNGSGAFSTQPFGFTVEDPALLQKVRDAMERRQEVKITYITVAGSACRSDSDNFLTSITVIDSKH